MAYTPGKGTTLKRVSTAIPQVRSLRIFSRTNPPVDNTHLGSTTRERAPTIIDNGTMVATILWDPTDSNHQQIESDFAAGTISSWVGTLADSGNCTYTGNCYVSNLEPTGLVVDNSLEMAVTLQSTGSLSISP